jgi:hypothetical protein
MDLSKIGTTKETTNVTLYHPVTSEVLLNDDNSEMTITVHGPYSKKYKTLSNSQGNRRLQKAQRTGGKMNLTVEEIEASSLDLLIKCVAGWSITLGGEQPECKEATVREVFLGMPWLKEQVDAVMADAQAFLET